MLKHFQVLISDVSSYVTLENLSRKTLCQGVPSTKSVVYDTREASEDEKIFMYIHKKHLHTLSGLKCMVDKLYSCFRHYLLEIQTLCWRMDVSLQEH